MSAERRKDTPQRQGQDRGRKNHNREQGTVKETPVYRQREARRRDEKRKRQMPAFLEVILAFFVDLKTAASGFIGRLWGKEKYPAVAGAGSRVSGRKYPDPRGRWTVIGIGLLLVLALLIWGVVWLLTNKNAIEVFLNGKTAGIIQEKHYTADDIMKTASAKLKEKMGGTEIEIYDTITINPVHASRADIISYDLLLSQLCNQFDYKIEAISIKVEGAELAIVVSLDEANTILENIMQSYNQEDIEFTSFEFIEEVGKDAVFVDPEQIMTSDKAYEILSQSMESEVLYQAVSGDSYNKIAAVNDLTLDDIQKLNPDLDINGVLAIGQQITLSVPKPILSVRTTQRTSYPDVEEKPVDRRSNPDKPKTYSRIIQQGSDGEKIVEVDIIRVNGFEVERKIIKETVTKEPVPEIIEVGTK